MNQTTPFGLTMPPSKLALDCSVIVAVNSDEVLRTSLLHSPDAEIHHHVIIQRGFPSAGLAYNAGREQAANDILLFVHQDVYLPKGWAAGLSGAILELQASDPNWGVLGVFGVATTGAQVGHVYSTGLGRVLGKRFTDPVKAVSLDEMVLVTRRSANLLFDAMLPGFHMYGTDICLEAAARGMKSYIVPAFCIHNSNGIRYLPFAFWQSYFYMRKKWWDKLPVPTPCTEITRGYWPLIKSLQAPAKRFLSRQQVGKRVGDPELLYNKLKVGVVE